MTTHRSAMIQRWSVGIGAIACIIGAVVLVLYKGVRHVEGEAERSQMEGNMFFLAYAMHNYVSANGGLPPAIVQSRDGKPLLSWRVLMLPFIEQAKLYSRFKLDEPWDSEHNRKLIPLMPKTYEPYHGCDSPPNTTFFQVIRGPGTPFERPGLKIADLRACGSTVFLIVEAAEPVIWTKPDVLEYHSDGPLPRLGGILRDGSFRATMGDGSTSTFSLTDEDAIRAGITGKAP